MLIEKEDAKKAICEVCYMYKYIGDEHKECRYYPCDDIKALEAIPDAPKPTVDLISRADAIRLLVEKYKFTTSEATEILSKLPSADVVKYESTVTLNSPISISAEAVQGWIPCSERLPSEDGRYLVCMDWGYDNMEVLKWADGWNCFRYPDGKVSRESEIDGADIVAWMPLPTSYKGGDDK